MKNALLKSVSLFVLMFVFSAASAFATTITVAATTIQDWKFGGTTAKLRIYPDRTFATDTGQIILKGSVTGNSWYKEIICTVAGNVLTIPAFTLESTVNSDQPLATYTAIFFDSKNLKRDVLLDKFKVPTSLGTSINWALLRTYNLIATRPPNPLYPTVDQVGQLIGNISTGVQTVEGRSGTVDVTKADVGLANVSNLDPSNLPLSNATATALSGKADLVPSTGKIPLDQIPDGIGTNRNVQTQSYASLATAQTTLGAVTSSTLNINVPTNCTTVLTLTRNITLEFTGTGMIVWQTGCVLTVESKILPTSKQIFSGFNRDNLILKADVPFYQYEWTGAVGRSDTDDHAPIQLIHDTTRQTLTGAGQTGIGGVKFLLPQKLYRLDKTLHIYKSDTIEGSASGGRQSNSTILKFPVNTTGIQTHSFGTHGSSWGNTIATGALGMRYVTAVFGRFSQRDVGKPVALNYYINNGTQQFFSTIASVTSATQVVIAANAPSAATNIGFFMFEEAQAYGAILKNVELAGGAGGIPNTVNNATITTNLDGTFAVNSMTIKENGVSQTFNSNILLNTPADRNISAVKKGFPVGTIITIGESDWQLNYNDTTGTGQFFTPRMHARFVGYGTPAETINGVFNESNINETQSTNEVKISGNPTFASWTVGARIRIGSRGYLIRTVAADGRSATLSWATPLAGESALPATDPVTGLAPVVGAAANIPDFLETVEMVGLPAGAVLNVKFNVYHGVDWGRPMTMKDVSIHDFDGNGVNIDSATRSYSDGIEPNLNNGRVDKVQVKDNRGNGFGLNGVNSNVNLFENTDMEANRGWGLMDNSDLGNTYINTHCLGNGFGCIWTPIPVNQSTFIGAYDEGGGADSILAPTNLYLGGVPASGFNRRYSRGATLLSLGNEKRVFGSSAYRTYNELPQLIGDTEGDLDTPSPGVMSQLGSSTGDYPLIFSFGAGNDGSNVNSAPHLRQRPSANYHFTYSKFTAGYYTLDYQSILSGVPNVSSVLRLSGSATAEGAAGAGKLWFPRGIHFGQKQITGNGLTNAYVPQFFLNVDSRGLVTEENVRVDTVQFIPNSNLETPSPASRSTMRIRSFGTAQVESATFTATTVQFGFITVDVVAAKLPTSPNRQTFFEVDGNSANAATPTQHATRARAALTALTDLNNLYIIGGTGATVTLTDRVEAPSDATLSMTFTNDNGYNPNTGFANKVSAETVAGATAGVYQVETMTVVGTVGAAGGGTITVNVYSPNISGTTKNSISVIVTVANSDTAAQVATKIAAALNANASYSARYTATASGTNVITTSKTFVDNDDALDLSYTLGTATGLTPVTSSANTTAGVSGDDVAEIAIKKGDGTIVWKRIP